MSNKLILASASPRRRELIELLGIEPEIIPSEVDETQRADETPEDLVIRLAEEKAESIAVEHSSTTVLAADTIVVLKNESGSEALGKPKDRNDACRMLEDLSGRSHWVYTGFAIVNKDKAIKHSSLVATEVFFRVLSSDEIDAYVETSEPEDKAGAYGIQGIAGAFVTKIHGSYSNVVGLPLSEVLDCLKDLGLWTPESLLRNRNE